MINQGAITIPYIQKHFSKTKILVKNNKFEYYTSPILNKFKFTHGFFTKSSSKKYLPYLSAYFNKKWENCFLNQIHSGKIVSGSKSQKETKIKADGLLGDKINQHLWIYTADCMPILFADKRKRYTAAIHCGRRGLEKKIIKNILKIFDRKGSMKEDILVAIGPSISRKNYLVNKKILNEFYKNAESGLMGEKNNENKSDSEAFKYLEDQSLINLDLKEFAHIQLSNENIPNNNIDISNLCTYESNKEFNSWRRTQTSSRQWSFISQ